MLTGCALGNTTIKQKQLILKLNESKCFAIKTKSNHFGLVNGTIIYMAYRALAARKGRELWRGAPLPFATYGLFIICIPYKFTTSLWPPTLLIWTEVFAISWQRIKVIIFFSINAELCRPKYPLINGTKYKYYCIRNFSSLPLEQLTVYCALHSEIQIFACLS